MEQYVCQTQFKCYIKIFQRMCQMLLASYWYQVLQLQLHVGSIVHSPPLNPSTWNGLPLEIRLLPKNNRSAFCRLLN